ncbi:thioredoxin-disulfide reductase [bacterium]|jgi:thioredoxin reductase (NADPH)|nr:thioredoxin-disulfide reductase [bacterium]MBT3581525.1 thioredoxin-disulfide reductase [bacterium]MBT4551519.1 thioredoxin-disulfide reductase [bacterium]MBT5988513.1 thioredoxin-disulfide reductase [bacterium]MBT7087527.1 thioredoxin-disulfide reductase [bacterium]
MENVIIAGSGPAGLTAAIYTARSGLKPLVLSGFIPGGQLTVSEAVANYPGFFEPISGQELMTRFRKQAERFGVRFKAKAIKNVTKTENALEVDMGSEKIETKALIIATGAQARRLQIPSEPKFYGRGISGCAVCDGSFFCDKHVLVIGGGDKAMQDAVLLTKFANKVTIVHRRDYLRASAIEIEKAKNNSKIEWLIPWIVQKILGKDTVAGVILKNTETEDVRELNCEGIFVAIGHDPKTEAFKDLVKIDENGFILVEPGSTRTSMSGIFACGDVCDPVYKQAAVAVGQGCMAALDLEKYLQKEK